MASVTPRCCEFISKCIAGQSTVCEPSLCCVMRILVSLYVSVVIVLIFFYFVPEGFGSPCDLFIC
jgi:hypothetical protein